MLTEWFEGDKKHISGCISRDNERNIEKHLRMEKCKNCDKFKFLMGR